MSRRTPDTSRAQFGILAVCFRVVLGLSLVVDAVGGAKVFERCELAELLRHKHALRLDELANWVCIAQHASGFDSEAYVSGVAGGSHGLFQISDVFWCSLSSETKGCNVSCLRLRDADLTDDLRCMRQIYSQHQKISGDGYDAWDAYQPFCRHRARSYVDDCFPQEASRSINSVAGSSTPNFLQIAAIYKNTSQSNYAATATHRAEYLINSKDRDPVAGLKKQRGRRYSRCELAQELHFQHKLPMDQIPTWVCIAEHESQLDTAAVGHLNADGSADHGLFQISDLYWCSKGQHGGGNACGLHCSKLLDDDISDDVRCIRRIHREHADISGDGFTAWTVYNRDCRHQQYEHVSACFAQALCAVHDESECFEAANAQKDTKQLKSKEWDNGKVYTQCELARELYFKHKMPVEEIWTWVCIAQHESLLRTAAVGNLNADGSTDHGLFQISDLYWCAHSDSGGKACNISCSRLLDSDISDDVRCVQLIHEEHSKISGDGFTAWTVYEPYCRHQQLGHIDNCFDGKLAGDTYGQNIQNTITGPANPLLDLSRVSYRVQEPIKEELNAVLSSQQFSSNPFLFKLGKIGHVHKNPSLNSAHQSTDTTVKPTIIEDSSPYTTISAERQTTETPRIYIDSETFRTNPISKITTPVKTSDAILTTTTEEQPRLPNSSQPTTTTRKATIQKPIETATRTTTTTRQYNTAHSTTPLKASVTQRTHKLATSCKNRAKQCVSTSFEEWPTTESTGENPKATQSTTKRKLSASKWKTANSTTATTYSSAREDQPAFTRKLQRTTTRHTTRTAVSRLATTTTTRPTTAGWTKTKIVTTIPPATTKSMKRMRASTDTTTRRSKIRSTTLRTITTKKPQQRFLASPSKRPTTTTASTTARTKTMSLTTKKPTTNSRSTKHQDNNNSLVSNDNPSHVTKSDPFSHPFFAKFNEQFLLLKTKTRTTTYEEKKTTSNLSTSLK